jgi:diaminohydroxyphosphoribosylaminopyrimidine deaminase / 5-amino-6-(5-phosphoribosylamino)uracil reductase
VLANDPRLDLRLPASLTLGRQPLRVVLDRNLSISPEAAILAPPGTALVYTAEDKAATAAALRAAGAEVGALPPGPGGLELPALLADLGGRGCNEVLVEAGPALAGSFVSARLADRLVVYLAPALMGAEARGMFALPGLTRMAERLQWRFVDVRPVGEDLRIVAEPA